MIEILIISALIWSSFILGLYYGSKVRKDEKIELPNPVKIVQKNIDEHRDNNTIRREQEIDEVNLYNIDNYDGTGIGQKDFPR